MKKHGILHAQLSGLIAALGHKDLFMIGDAGMPIPPGVTVVDLALCGGVPTFCQVLDAVLEDTEIEFYTLAEEIKAKNPKLLAYIEGKMQQTPGEFIEHTALKEMSAQVRFAIRTGEFTPYPNVILRAGVAFPA